MALQVVDADEGDASSHGQGLGHGQPDQQGAHEARPPGDGDAFDRVEGDPRSFEGFQDDGNDHLDVLARRDLGDDTAVLLVDPDL